MKVLLIILSIGAIAVGSLIVFAPDITTKVTTNIKEASSSQTGGIGKYIVAIVSAFA